MRGRMMIEERCVLPPECRAKLSRCDLQTERLLEIDVEIAGCRRFAETLFRIATRTDAGLHMRC